MLTFHSQTNTTPSCSTKDRSMGEFSCRIPGRRNRGRGGGGPHPLSGGEAKGAKEKCPHWGSLNDQKWPNCHQYCHLSQQKCPRSQQKCPFSQNKVPFQSKKCPFSLLYSQAGTEMDKKSILDQKCPNCHQYCHLLKCPLSPKKCLFSPKSTFSVQKVPFQSKKVPFQSVVECPSEDCPPLPFGPSGADV